jgi:hypothetical protein
MPHTYTKNFVGTLDIMEWTQFITSVHFAHKNVPTTNSMILRLDRVVVFLGIRYRWTVISWTMFVNVPYIELFECLFTHRCLTKFFFILRGSLIRNSWKNSSRIICWQECHHSSSYLNTLARRKRIFFPQSCFNTN